MILCSRMGMSSTRIRLQKLPSERLGVFLCEIGFPGILDESSDRHRSDTTRSRSDPSYIVFQVIEVSISAGDTTLERISDIYHDSIFSHHITSDESWRTSCDDEYICIFCIFTNIRSSTIATCDRCSGIYEHQRHRLSDDIRSSYDDDVFSFHIDIVVFQKCYNPFWSTAPESIVP